ncbi:uncharacterized protein ASPGLDRAFT_406441 [Aspergillus glaucus CBS 516.65]|uniref:Secreted protein n=1 Tax=Aspergillus glaucus CBS 516.65 TaxID=1160497 RepID=A0A1L9VHX8_ASPGL|nr:hypothetical protein ASPGLDRAFT_406441 [Aspergillus glaucus CBS 516.65]OJJ83493.1 hypothetical protein ASPGLDRAFT_406441 [Aspergillus glaucus CBS 516.65]
MPDSAGLRHQHSCRRPTQILSLFLSLLVRSSSPTTSTPQSTTHQPAFVPFLIDLLHFPKSGVAKLWITRGISSPESDSAFESDFSLLVSSSSLVAFSSHSSSKSIFLHHTSSSTGPLGSFASI